MIFPIKSHSFPPFEKHEPGKQIKWRKKVYGTCGPSEIALLTTLRIVDKLNSNFPLFPNSISYLWDSCLICFRSLKKPTNCKTQHIIKTLSFLKLWKTISRTHVKELILIASQNINATFFHFLYFLVKKIRLINQIIPLWMALLKWNLIFSLVYGIWQSSENRKTRKETTIVVLLTDNFYPKFLRVYILSVLRSCQMQISAQKREIKVIFKIFDVTTSKPQYYNLNECVC